MSAEIETNMRVPRGRVEIVNDPALSEAELNCLAVPSSKRGMGPGTRFIAVGRLVAQKNFDLLLQAFAAAKGPHDRLLVLGDGSERAELVQRARDLGIIRRVSFPGHVADISNDLRASDVLVLSSDYEGVPAVILEALAAGLAIVATDCSVSMAHLLDDGALGSLVPVRNCQALAEAMRHASALRPKVLQRQLQAARFTVECAASAYLNIFSSLAENRAPPRSCQRQDAAVLANS